jgi:hypothetical protein
MKIPRKTLRYYLLPAVLLVLSGCWELDVVGQGSVASFNEVLSALPGQPEKHTSGGVTAWTITAPDKMTTFTWSDDFDTAGGLTAEIKIDPAPFIAAGGDRHKLETLTTLGGNFGPDAARGYGPQQTPLEAYRQIAYTAGGRVGYHAALDHFGIELGGGHMFEWAKDMGVNDKDIVFALNPEPFIAAGVNPDKVEGWVFAKVPVMDSAGNKIEVDKLLKPFDIN